MTRQTAQEIDREAADWAARVDRGLSPAEQLDLDGWLAGDIRRTGAFAIMRATALQTERAVALGPSFTPQDFAETSDREPSRRRLLLAGGGLVAACAAATVAGLPLWRGDRYRTRKGEVRQLALRDGSAVTLNTDSVLHVRFSDQRRELRLLQGEALFDVAHDKSRPFVVRAGETEAVAVGTSFTVRRLPGEAVQVLVREGVVEVRREDVASKPVQRLAVNMRAVSTAGAVTAATRNPVSVTQISEPELQRALAWRGGQLAFEGETLAVAAGAFSRYSDTRIIVDDPQLAREEIAGLYQATDPIGFAQSIALSLGAHAQVSEGEVRVYR
ncbi:FecR family protein [Caulobacter sp. RHG1]|uniref:FecR family protein n=1 Tax=Caulobacter sp. (strain RHG1) TaxID=2545762 RepID=UPI0015561DF0|nr:FecR domain-containing protein [Caulobacter sp. RHG1]